MATKSFTKEQLNFFKFSTLVFDEFPKVLRQIFIAMWNGKVAISPGFITWDDSSKVRNMLLTSEGGKTDIPTAKSIEEWDCTALFNATIYAKTFGVSSSKGSNLNDIYLKKIKPAPGCFHSSVQSATGNKDETYALAIDQLRLLRNTLCHSPKQEMIKSDFDHYVQLVTSALTAVNVDTTFVDVIGQISEDDLPTEKVKELHECRMKELQATSMFHENVEQKLSQLHTLVENISIGDKANIPDNPPKSHIPSAVPLFTGREDEIKAITNLVTDESTRLLNIWGSPGFGKTSTAIQLAHNLLSLEYPVYFFKLQGICTLDEVLSKMLSIFKCSSADVSLAPVDKLVCIFREISCPIFLILDNLDDLLSSDTSSAELTRLFVEFLDSNININILLTTREFLENIRDLVKGFQNVRIRPLGLLSASNLVHQLLPSFSESLVVKVARTSSHVPLAIKLVASLVKDTSEEMANKVLEELQFPENRLEHLEKNMQKLFDTPFEQLTSTDKHALISLSVFCSATISKDAAIDVLSEETQVASNAIRSLKTLVNKSLIDEDPNGKYYSIHPLIHSFVVDKAKLSGFRNVLESSRIGFCRYYLLLFERLNDRFLAGKSMNTFQLEDVMLHLSSVIKDIPDDYQNAQHLFRILSKAEIFLSLIRIKYCIGKLYNVAIEKCKTISHDGTYIKLYVSNYFRNIAFSFFVNCWHLDIPKAICKKLDRLGDGTAAKLFCYEGIDEICSGNVQNGIQQIEMFVGRLEKCSDQLLLKCLCLQILTLYYNNLNELDKSCKFKEMAVKVCSEIGNSNLLLIADSDFPLSKSPRENAGEALVLFNYLLTKWSEQFSGDNAKQYIFHFVYNLQQQQLVEECVSDYLNQIFRYGDFLLVFLSLDGGQKTLLDEKMEFLIKSLKDLQNSDSLTNKTIFRSTMQCWFRRLVYYCNLRATLENKDLYIEARRSALDISLQQYGRQHPCTAECYFNIGLAEDSDENYSSALDAFDHALNIMLAVSRGPGDFTFAARIYIEQGCTYQNLRKYKLAIASYEKALEIARKTKIDQECETIAQILRLLQSLLLESKDMSSAVVNLIRALRMRISSMPYANVAYLFDEFGMEAEYKECLGDLFVDFGPPNLTVSRIRRVCCII